MKNDIRNLVNFRASSRKSENVHFNGLLLSRAYNVLDEKVQEFDYFWPNSRKSKNLHINGLLLTKVYNVWAKKLQRSYMSWHRRMMWYLKKNWLVIWKKNMRKLVNFHASSRKSENLHFDGLILSKAYKVLDEKVQKRYVSWHWITIQRKANSCGVCIACVIQ